MAVAYFVPLCGLWHPTCATRLTKGKVIWNRTGTGVCVMLDEEVDDKGTDQQEAQNILETLRDRGFDSDNQKLAVALGRSAEQIQATISGAETIDDDIVMKARGIALNRGIEVEKE